MEWSENKMKDLNYVGEGYAKQKAKFVLVDEHTEIPVQFNPNEYSTSSKAEYVNISDEKENDELGKIQYKYTSLGKLDLKLYFASTNENKNVTDLTKPIEDLAGRAINGGHKPPKVKFIWGKFEVLGYVESVKTKFALFDADGIPIRAEVDVTMIRDASTLKKNPKHSPDRTKTRVFSEDISLWSLAQKEYDDANEWRRIAKANGIMNPFEIETGQVLVVPAIVKEDC
ncbi:CIS tube protein [[Clostridium] polysaccharolyticum]|jgi:nucleoid-associated protein YgaU|uniref:LysM domain-containing protein n=1 Tax=[Clostridium] polysaccharolyticum TaxID=29364 RepID=A0A1I0CAB2_9FIRM|nr:LysM peptidoglycan-binding domain-containing protein [[Clostridium] polysaccharolyticum]SET16191.1 hypothetical protein SAMN04487772_10983 [[Clostridium] polysaccharolyticum]